MDPQSHAAEMERRRRGVRALLNFSPTDEEIDQELARAGKALAPLF